MSLPFHGPFGKDHWYISSSCKFLRVGGDLSVGSGKIWMWPAMKCVMKALMHHHGDASIRVASPRRIDVADSAEKVRILRFAQWSLLLSAGGGWTALQPVFVPLVANFDACVDGALRRLGQVHRTAIDPQDRHRLRKTCDAAPEDAR